MPALASAILAPGAGFAAEDAPTVVLGLESLGGTPDAVAGDITDALRQRVAAAHGFQLLQGKDLLEVKLVFACPDEAPACMSQAGKSLGATKLIFGNVKQAGNDYQVTLKLLDVSRAVVESYTADIRGKSLTDDGARKLIAESVAIEQAEADLRSAYAKRLGAVLPVKKVARYLQIENKIRALVKYDLVTGFPLVE